jgi:hypothetical protein
VNLRHVIDLPQPGIRADLRKEDAQELSKGHADRSDSPGLYDQKQRPAIQKSPDRPQRLAQINVLPSGFRHHRGELAVAERSDQRHRRRHQPRRDQQRRRTQRPAHIR